MATLSDLFVSYKSVQPEPTETSTTYRNGLANLTLARGRLQQIEDAHRAQQEVGESLDENEVIEEQPDETLWSGSMRSFRWFTRQPAKAFPTATTGSMTQTKFIPSGKVVKYNRGRLDQEIKELFDRVGINVHITSGKRNAGTVGKAGARSHHIGGNAVDIVPGNGETFDSIRQKMSTHPEILQFFYDNGLGVIDETTAETMTKTGATGKHFHIGPDQLALKTWSSWTGNNYSSNKPTTKQEWIRTVNDAFVKGLKDEYGSKYSTDTYNRIATYMTYQAALESGYGEKANGFNYSGHMRNGKTIHYNTMDEFVKAHIKTLKKWDFMNANSLQEYVNSLYQGKYKYNAHDSASRYYAAINGTAPRVNRYLGLKAKFGGKFQAIRQLYEQSFS